MEKINRKICEIQDFLEIQKIPFRYIDYKLIRGSEYIIYVVFEIINAPSLFLMLNHENFTDIKPYTSIHLVANFRFIDL